jgi:hypothetical protein
MDGMSEYFESVGIHLGCEGSDLKTVLSDQPILWSTPRQNFGVSPEEAEGLKRNAFAIHSKMVTDWPQYAQDTLEICKTVHGCYANYTNEGILDISCLTDFKPEI